MKKKYKIINKNGKFVSKSKMKNSKDLSADFKHFVEIELGNVKDLKQKGKSNYLEVSNKLGFNWEERADIGLMQYDYKADIIMRLLKEYSRQLVNRIGFPVFEVRGSNIFDLSHPVVQSYSKLYGERLYKFKSGKKEVVMSYDASYPQFNLAGKYQLSEKDLPFAHFSISDCYRHEQSGECMLLYRMRRFFMPDIHPYFKNVHESFAWFGRIEDKILLAGNEGNLKYQVLVEVSSEENWKKYKDCILDLFKGKEILIEIHKKDSNRYWIINVDYKIVDKFNQSREIACIQIDLGNAKRLGIKYIDKDNKSHYPAIIHSAVPGGFERYLYAMIDDFEKRFPIWLHPIQIRLIPISREYVKKCQEIASDLKGKIRVDIDDRDESVSKRVKRSIEELVPNYLVFGEKEVSNNAKKLKVLAQRIQKDSEGKPFLDYSWPILVSRQVS